MCSGLLSHHFELSLGFYIGILTKKTKQTYKQKTESKYENFYLTYEKAKAQQGNPNPQTHVLVIPPTFRNGLDEL